MGKPTLFFSHSSKDKDLILSIKNRLDKATGSVMDIFMSSDGQSIPFGSNWIHKIENGLEEAEIMFVFVTENSISSGWIYFEAGFAYSKGVQVVPVGIGIDIGGLKPPLNMLQGFNIISGDSLNNFISIINRTFNYNFSESFQDEDYSEILLSMQYSLASEFDFSSTIDYGEYELSSEYLTADEEKVTHDISGFFEKIKAYLCQNNIPYSIGNHSYDKRYTIIVVKGIKIVYRSQRPSDNRPRTSLDDRANITFRISTYNFASSFELLRQLLKLSDDNGTTRYIWLHLNKSYRGLIADEESSAIISEQSNYEIDTKWAGSYLNKPTGLKFTVRDKNRGERGINADYVISVVFDCVSVKPEDIMKLIADLQTLGIVCRCLEQ